MAVEAVINGNGSRNADMRNTRWAAVTGLWQFDGPNANYKAPSSELAYGLALTNWNLTDGIAQVDVEFSEVDVEGNISAGLVLGSNPNAHVTCWSNWEHLAEPIP